MKEFLAVISLLVSGAVAEPPAPYPASGWRPSGPAFELPQPGKQQQPPQYLAPVDPRNPANIPNVEYGIPEEDVSVQGLPPQREEVPFFQRSPVNGQQNVGPAFNSDIRNLDQNLQQIQYQQQQAYYREFARQRQQDGQINANRLPRPNVPAVFVPRTTSTTTEASTTEATTIASTTEISLNEGETLASPKKQEKVSVEVSAQKIQEYPGELFLSSLAQLQLQPQFVPLQFGQTKAPLYLQPLQSQKQVSGFDAQTHFAALPLIIAQQKLQQQNSAQNFQSPGLTISEQPQAVPQLQPVTAYQQPQFQTEQVEVQPQPQNLYGQPNVEPVVQLQPQFQLQPLSQLGAQPIVLQPQPAQLQPQSAQFQPQPAQFQPQPAQFQPTPAQFQPQPVQFQPQPAQFQPQPAQFQPQPGRFQPQPAQFQPQPAQFQPQTPQFQPQPNNEDAENIDQSSYQPQLYQSPFLAPQQPGFIQAPLINYPTQDFSQAQFQFQQNQFQQQSQYQPQNQGPDALQSGLDANQQGNDIEDTKDQEEEDQDNGNTANAVATAFGTRTQPRVYTQYGAPFPVPKVQASSATTTTELPTEEVTDDGPVVAHSVAIAEGTRKKSAKVVRRSRVRPIFTLDKSGHLVLTQQ